MSKVITFSRHFQKGHPREGQPTMFVEKILESKQIGNFSGIYKHLLTDLNPSLDSKELENFFLELNPSMQIPKLHTIRSGNRFKVGDKFSPRVWSGMPYRSKQIIIAPDLEVKKVYSFETTDLGDYIVNNYLFYLPEMIEVAKNDGLEIDDFECWFDKPPFKGQIICWSDQVNYN